MYVNSSAEVQPSFVETTSSTYSLDPYGLVQPLQVREVLKTSRDHSEQYGGGIYIEVVIVTVESVQLHQSGWALLVIRTKIYLWRYNGKVIAAISYSGRGPFIHEVYIGSYFRSPKWQNFAWIATCGLVLPNLILLITYIKLIKLFL